MQHWAQSILWKIALLFVGGLLLGACGAPTPEPRKLLPAPSPTSLVALEVLEAKVAQAPTRAIPVQLSLLHTNDVRGVMDPCG